MHEGVVRNLCAYSMVAWHGIWCMLVFFLRAVLEIICSVLVYADASEVPKVTCVATPRNAAIVDACGALRRFTPAWWAVGPYAQTLVQTLRRADAGCYRRDVVAMHDGVQVALDWKEHASLPDSAPIVVCLHALGGDSGSKNVRVLTRAALRRGYRSVVYNRRSHGGMSLLSAEAACIVPKHSNMSDMLAVMSRVTAAYPTARGVYVIGFSAGANLCINYLATEHGRSTVTAAAAVSNGYDIFNGTQFLKNHDPICDGVVAQMFKDTLRERADEVQLLADRAGMTVNVRDVMRCRSFTDIEERLRLRTDTVACVSTRMTMQAT